MPLANTPNHRQQALNYVNQLQAGGGTEMLRGIQEVLSLPTVTDRLRSIVLLTDGYIGNENQILAQVQRNLQPSARLHSFGAGSSVNRFLLNRVAEIGRGISEVVRADQPTDSVVEHFFKQINNPVLVNIQLDWDGAGEAPQIYQIYPTAPPDLFAEQPLVLFGRKADRQPGILSITGTLAGGACYEQRFTLNFETTGNSAISQFWGRARIKELMSQMVRGETKTGVEDVTQTALTYQLLSQYTAFVAVSDDVRGEAPQEWISTQVPVNLPESVSYEGIFGTRSLSPPMGPRIRSSKPKAASRRASAIANEAPEFRCYSAHRFIANEAPGEICFAPPFQSSEPTDLATDLGGWQLRVLRAENLNETAIESLQQHLQAIPFEARQAGDLVFELRILKGRVKQVILDEQASSLSDEKLIEMIQRSLFSWYHDPTLTAVVYLQIQIQS